ncbi:transcriptional regulator [Thioclava sp. NG1]|uniref:helix-turn-helix domain-containing protein n=1 Tax=Thioclava sp. NG1 TaxID=2182426 RepID=UPI000D61A3B9|nr:helix-turn-helix domain-containing protein [Thioclava sp. NG1]PWE48102.1 transcriptional regulator [Thioclava sp. NG1]
MTIQSNREFAALARIAKVGDHKSTFATSPADPVTHYAAGDLIFGQGDHAGKIFTVKGGMVRLYHLFADGRRQILAFCMPGEVFGFAAHGTYEFFAEAIEDSSVAVHDEQNSLTEVWLSALKAHLLAAQSQQLVLGRQYACERLVSFLLDMSSRQRGQKYVELSMTRSDIADYLGLTLETVSRGLSRLKKDGLIRLHSARCIEISAPAALQEMIE